MFYNTYQHLKKLFEIYRKEGFVAALKYDKTLSFADQNSASKTLVCPERSKTMKVCSPQQIQHAEQLYESCLSHIRKGIAIEAYEGKAREIAKTANLPLDSLEDSLSEGVNRVFDECVLKVKKGINVSFYESRGRAVAERYMLSVEPLEKVILKGRKKQIVRCVLLADKKDDVRYMRKAERLSKKYGYDLDRIIRECDEFYGL